MKTIFALSSGSPPAGIAVVRISGPSAGTALASLVGAMPAPRRATARKLRSSSGDELDHAMVLWLPGPATATGEDVAELHLHGGRAVVAAVESELATLDGLRRAEAGEFTRRAFLNGRIDLAESEGLADLLEAETEMQRRSAMAMAGGALSREIEAWREQVLHLSAQVEAVLDFSDEEDAAALPPSFTSMLDHLRSALESWLSRPPSRVLKEGYRVVLAGPPNAGKSTLFNGLINDDAAITAPTAGTTRDVLERSVAIGGVAFTFVDTAGLRDSSDDAIEQIGIARAKSAAQRADLVLWLGNEGGGPEGAWEIEAKCDETGDIRKPTADYRVSAKTGAGMAQFTDALLETARGAMPGEGKAALSERQHRILENVHASILSIIPAGDLLLTAESLRQIRVEFDRLIGRTSTEDMLDALFGRFCIGK
ncbi:tRNA uridine-5-carboxymethylaminomethyl(34) synthesis GTPase MnmE [Altererythrobacter confluentis]|uniref:tRNA modification GTPase MnmE n=1 Tax=Allopontixanthobacter confluentis TaxID=1849021 RepID=A0A6L7GH30_9SPHN|nr:tRNA uridine-5-carboxymethylaminomethyl(34) synthesis GTPase MnmE [Allopontixanthobacter confluentis]MXP15217.1 tRNA uridine-5-carboxymethylaminomethyl(34) synthesis GTPase MnmE [Allopontixanthobacter confluentis]